MKVVRKGKKLIDIFRELDPEDAEPPKYPKMEQYGIPDFPTDLTVVSYKELGKLHSSYASFMAFLNEKIAETRNQLAFAKVKTRKLRANIIFTSRGIKMQKAAAVYRDLNFNNSLNKLTDLNAMLVSYNAIMWSIKDYMKAVVFERDRRMYASQANSQD